MGKTGQMYLPGSNSSSASLFSVVWVTYGLLFLLDSSTFVSDYRESNAEQTSAMTKLARRERREKTMEASEGQEQLFFGDLLKKFRGRKKLSQQRFAEQIGASREAVSLWERGYYKPETEAILYEIGRILGLNEQEQQQLFEAYSVTAQATSFHNPPLRRNPYFTGRSPQLTNLHTLLMAGKQVALTQAISGLGGIGKTQLALEYAYRYQRSYHDIFWVSADTYDTLMTSYVRLAAVLKLPEANEQDQNKVRMAVQRWLTRHKRWLLILDNVEDLSLVDRFIPADRQGAVLLTTRRHVTEPVAQALELEPLSENDAILFLLKRTKVLDIERPLGEASDPDIEAARAITRLLGNLPLALDQAGAYILETQCTFADYLALFQTYHGQLLQRRVGEGIPTDHPDSVTATFRLNFQHVQQRSNAAGELLCFCAYLAPDSIPEEILVAGESSLGPVLAPVAADAFQLNQALEVLQAYSLIRRNSTEKTLSIHRLVQVVLQEGLEETERRTWAERAMLAVNAAFPEGEFANWERCERLVSHALVCADYIKKRKLISEEGAHLLNRVGEYLWRRAKYGEVLALYQEALAIQKQVLPPNHPDVAESVNNVAFIYYRQGKYLEALPLYQQALAIWEQTLGPNHTLVALCLNNLAENYRSLGQYAEALPLYQRALSIREQVGPERPQVAHPLNGLASLYAEQGQYELAEPLYQRALHIWERLLGPEHPDVAFALNGLASLYAEQGQCELAESLYQRTLHIWERLLGPENPDVASALNGLANLYASQGKYAQAESLYWRALHICEQALGSQHPKTAEVMHNFARLREAQDNNEEARTWYTRALEIRGQKLGVHHPKTRETRKHLITLLHTIGLHEEAAKLAATQTEPGGE